MDTSSLEDDSITPGWVREIGEMSNPFQNVKLPMTSRILKYSLFFSNLLIYILGIVLMSTGFTVSAEYASANGLAELFQDNYTALPESTTMTLIYGILLFLTMVSLLLAGIFGYLYRDAVDHYVEGQLTTSLKHWCHSNPEPWDSIQKYYKCCGITSPKDWSEKAKDFEYWAYGYAHLNNLTSTETKFSETPVPSSCCAEISDGCGLLEGGNIHEEGCLNKLEQNIADNLSAVAGAAVGISIFTLIGIFVAFFLFRKYRERNYSNMD
ncbi:Oidioi.mRNA.OKI2018_I69.chr1.g674.t2.cds [Oikopleura dioica]|uniref:Tetraspanin n=1 Tax=Oikopleura dioica TaxID=34765 RepID=A0ABN7SPF3_OIKDI|nr:Oidioi.mRNA.OKI2018_I69.chr1.g674.t2.cds [Oikopleura dioica]